MRGSEISSSKRAALRCAPTVDGSRINVREQHMPPLCACAHCGADEAAADESRHLQHTAARERASTSAYRKRCRPDRRTALHKRKEAERESRPARATAQAFQRKHEVAAARGPRHEMATAVKAFRTDVVQRGSRRSSQPKKPETGQVEGGGGVAASVKRMQSTPLPHHRGGAARVRLHGCWHQAHAMDPREEAARRRPHHDEASVKSAPSSVRRAVSQRDSGTSCFWHEKAVARARGHLKGLRSRAGASLLYPLPTAATEAGHAIVKAAGGCQQCVRSTAARSVPG